MPRPFRSLLTLALLLIATLAMSRTAIAQNSAAVKFTGITGNANHNGVWFLDTSIGPDGRETVKFTRPDGVQMDGKVLVRSEGYVHFRCDAWNLSIALYANGNASYLCTVPYLEGAQGTWTDYALRPDAVPLAQQPQPVVEGLAPRERCAA